MKQQQKKSPVLEHCEILLLHVQKVKGGLINFLEDMHIKLFLSLSYSPFLHIFVTNGVIFFCVSITIYLEIYFCLV